MADPILPTERKKPGPKPGFKPQPKTDGVALGGSVMVERGMTGLKHFSGMVNEEFLRELQGPNGIKLLTEMRENHPIIGGFMYAIEMLARGVTWSVEAASDSPEDVEAADFISSCLDDMEFSWQDTISEILSFLTYGFDVHEICYKVRRGPENEDPVYRSRYDDNKIGWRKFAQRSQDSLYRWDIAADGAILGMVQHVYQTELRGQEGYERYIPMDKALLFRTKSFKNNPHGRSILRNAVTTYLAQRKIEDIERIGIERDLAGLPVLYAPGKIMGPQATPAEKQLYADLKNIVTQVRRDAAEGIVLPSDTFKDSNNKQYDLTLLSAPGSRQFDTTAVLTRLDNRIAMVVLADFILLGHTQVGTYSLSESKTDLFVVALAAFLDVVCEEMNRKAVPDLLKLNGMTLKETPSIKHGDFDQMDIEKLGNYVQSLANAGMPIFPDPAVEKHLRDVAGLPEPSLDIGREMGTGSGEAGTGGRIDNSLVQTMPDGDMEKARRGGGSSKKPSSEGSHEGSSGAKPSLDSDGPDSDGTKPKKPGGHGGGDNGGGNPYHDPETGRFTNGPGGPAGNDGGFKLGGWEGRAKYNPETGEMLWQEPTPAAERVIDAMKKQPFDTTQNKNYKQNLLPQAPKPSLPSDFDERVKNGQYEVLTVDSSLLVSHQVWIDDYRLVKMTTTSDDEWAALPPSAKYPSAVKVGDKYHIIDGNHRACLNLILGRNTTLRVVDVE